MDLHREQLAWAAGFFDGEGSVHFTHKNFTRHGNPTNSGYMRLTISQKLVGEETWWGESESLERFRTAVGGIGQIHVMQTQQLHKYNVSNFQHIQAVIAMLWPWLGEIKKNDYKFALNEYRKRGVYIGRVGRPSVHRPGVRSTKDA